MSSVKPWKDICPLRDEVKRGELKAADFAADLNNAHRGDGPPIYSDPVAFFSRTYAGHTLKELVAEVLQRLAGKGGAPVTWLHVSYGGGKTHSLITLRHLAREGDKPDVANHSTVREFLVRAGLSEAPQAEVALLLGDKFGGKEGFECLSPRGAKKTLKTPWGALAYQLADETGLALVAEHERDWVTPAQPLIERVLKQATGSGKGALILIDELVDLAAGAMQEDPNRLGVLTSFFQYLTQAVANTPRCALVATLISADFGDQPNKAAAQRNLEPIFARLSQNREPVTQDDLAEVLRRRLFDYEALPPERERRAIVSAIIGARKNAGPLMDSQRDSQMEQRILASYPFHPDLLNIFYTKWTELPNFQRTRGALRLLAVALRDAASHDPQLLIESGAFLPSPDATTLSEAMGEMCVTAGGDGNVWRPKVEQELRFAREIQQENPPLQGGRDIERAVIATFLHSQPQEKQFRAENKDLWVLLVTPGSDVSALETGLNEWRNRSWFLAEDPATWRLTTLPNLNHIFNDALKDVTPTAVEDDLKKRIQEYKPLFDRGEDNNSVEAVKLPNGSNEVTDDGRLRYVVLRPTMAVAEGGVIPAIVTDFFTKKGAGGRTFGNAVLLLAPDPAQVSSLDRQMRDLLGWERVSERRIKELSDTQRTSLRKRLEDAKQAIPGQILKTYSTLICLDAKGKPVAQLLPSGDNVGTKSALDLVDIRPFARVKALLKGQDRLMVEPLAPRFLLPGGHHKLWADGETEKEAEEMRNLYASQPRLPRLLSPRLFRETLKQGCKDGLFVLRYVRPFGTENCWWRTEVEDDDLARDELKVLPASTATLTYLSPDLLAPGVLPELWPESPILRYGDLQAYFDKAASAPHNTPYITPDALAAAVQEAVNGGKLLARTMTTSYQREALPASEIRPDIELLPAAPPLAPYDLTSAALPDVWINGSASVSLIVDELRTKLGYIIPGPLLYEAIATGIQTGLWNINGATETLPRDRAGLIALTLRTGGETERSLVIPIAPGATLPRLAPTPVVRETPFAERSGMTPVEMSKMLGELMQWQGQHPELSFSFAVTVTLDGPPTDPATLASLNEWLRQKRVTLEFEK